MRNTFLIIFLFAVISICVVFSCLSLRDVFDDDKKDNSEITNENFSGENELIFYWAKWCGVCTKVKPDWNIAKTNIMNKYRNLKVSEIECDDPNKCYIIKGNKKEIIEGVPTIILRKKGDDIEYQTDQANNIKCNKKSDDLLRFLDLYI